MKLRLADPELKPLQEEEVIELLNQPIYLRVAMINASDGTPLVHPIWYNYKDGRFFAVSNKNGTKVRSLKKNPEVYFLVDITDRGVRGKASAKVIDDSEYATKITAQNLERYMEEEDDIISVAAVNYSIDLYSLTIKEYYLLLLILIQEAFPINILPRLKDVPEIVNIYCATANPIEVIFVERAVLGVVDGFRSKGVEAETDIEDRKQFLRKIGYKI